MSSNLIIWYVCLYIYVEHMVSYILFGFFSIISAICIIIMSNPVFSVLFLILSVTSGSILLFFLEIDFLPLIFIIIYVGAVAILFLFVVMMLNIKQHRESTLSLLKFLPFLIFFLFVYLTVLNHFLNNHLGFLSFSNFFYHLEFDLQFTDQFYLIRHFFENLKKDGGYSDFSSAFFYEIITYHVDKLLGTLSINQQLFTNIEILGLFFYTEFFSLLLIAGFILLIAMVGSVNLTMPYRRRYSLKKQTIALQLLRDSRNNVILLSNK